MKAVIVGSGIAGLAATIALEREYISCAVYERAPEVRELGAGLAMWTNGVHALQQLGVRDQAIATGSLINQGVSMSDGGKVLDRVDLAKFSRQHGAECICIHRGELQRILLEAAGRDRIWTGSTCVSVEQSPERATVCLDDGSRVEADFIVAADGIRSTIRNQLRPPPQLRFAGYSAWRALAPGHFPGLPEHTALLIVGSGCQAGIFPCGSQRAYWFATHNGATDLNLSPEARKIAVLTKLGRWPAPLPDIMEATPAEDILENDIFDLPPLADWGIGRITFAGDSIHAVTPNLGQGAALALEDAVVLARGVKSGIAIERALREYERARRERTTWIANASWRLGKVLQMENPIGVRLRDWFQSTNYAHRQGERLLDRLFAFQ